MEEEELQKYKSQFEELTSARSEAEKNVWGLLLKNIEYLREFNSTLLSIQVVVLGVVLGVLFTGRFIFLNNLLLYAGIMILIANIVFIVAYTQWTLAREHNALVRIRASYREEFTAELNRVSDAVRENESFEDYYQEYSKAVKEYFQNEVDRRNDKNLELVAYLPGTLFVLSLLLLIISLLCS